MVMNHIKTRIQCNSLYQPKLIQHCHVLKFKMGAILNLICQISRKCLYIHHVFKIYKNLVFDVETALQNPTPINTVPNTIV